MRICLLLVFFFITTRSLTQDKRNHIYFNKITELKGTPYVIASVENWGKIGAQAKYLLFINTVDGQSTQVDFDKDSYFEKIEQVKNDSLGINLVIVKVNERIFILSYDGHGKQPSLIPAIL